MQIIITDMKNCNRLSISISDDDFPNWVSDFDKPSEYLKELSNLFEEFRSVSKWSDMTQHHFRACIGSTILAHPEDDRRIAKITCMMAHSLGTKCDALVETVRIHMDASYNVDVMVDMSLLPKSSGKPKTKIVELK